MAAVAKSVSERCSDDGDGVVGDAMHWLANLAEGRRDTNLIFTLSSAGSGTAAGFC